MLVAEDSDASLTGMPREVMRWVVAADSVSKAGGAESVSSLACGPRLFGRSLTPRMVTTPLLISHHDAPPIVIPKSIRLQAMNAIPSVRSIVDFPV